MLSGAAVAEPDSYRQDDYRAPVPDTLKGAAVLHTAALSDLMAHGGAVLIDVIPAPRPPPDRPAGSPWMPLPRLDIPGSVWLPNSGRGTLSPAVQAWFASRITALAAAHPGQPLVFYCLSHCWMSWNAARRAVLLGVGPVAWYPDGSDGWEAAGHKLAPARPQ